VPDDRRAAAKADREKKRAVRDREYKAMQSGDEKNLPYRDRGPVRRYIRDYVDARWNVGEYFLFLAMAFLVMTLFANRAPALAVYALIALYVVVLVAIVDAFVMWRMLKKRLLAKFGEEQLIRGTTMYAVMRAFQIRRARLPKAQVKHGQFPV
jgi:Flp pilus assembly protein TadB